MSLCDFWFFRPTRHVYDDPSNYGLRYADVEIPVQPGRNLHGWFLEGQGSPRALVVHCHGNAGNLTAHFPFVSWMPEAHLDVLMFDYRGYGRSPGKPNRSGIIEDGLAATRFAVELARQRRVPLILFGQSLGGVVAAAVAARESAVAGVVLDSTFSGYRREAAWISRQSRILRIVWKLAGNRLISSGCDAIGDVPRIAPRPVLIIHAKDDRIVDWHQAIELYEAAGHPKDLWLLDQCDHCGMWDGHLDQARARFLAFLDRL